MSNFVGAINKELAMYVVIKLTYSLGAAKTYTMVDDADNVLIWQTEKIIDDSGGNHYFLIEGIVKEHKEFRGVKQTFLKDCDWEVVDKIDKIQGIFYGKPGDIVELDNVTATYRQVYDTEWIVNGEFAIVAPESQYRLIIARKYYTFMLPYDSKQKLSVKSTGKFNIKGKVIGYMVEKGARVTFLYPIAVEDKNGPLHATPVGALSAGFRK